MRVVDYGADYRVKISSTDYGADFKLSIKTAAWTECWKFVPFFEDFTVEFVNIDEDFTVYFD